MPFFLISFVVLALYPSGRSSYGVCLTKVLAVTHQLQQRGIEIDHILICEQCSSLVETMYHIFRFSVLARQVWHNGLSGINSK